MKTLTTVAAAALLTFSTSFSAVAQTAPDTRVQYVPPKVGTRFNYDNSYQNVVRSDGKMLVTMNRSNRPFYRYGLFIGFSNLNAYQFPKEKMDALWPLKVGNSVSFDASGTSSNGYESTWQWTITVLRAEDLTTPAGTYKTLVVEARERTVAGSYEGVYTYWYAPAISFFAKYKYEILLGNGRPFQGTLRNVEIPK